MGKYQRYYTDVITILKEERDNGRNISVINQKFSKIIDRNTYTKAWKTTNRIFYFYLLFSFIYFLN